MPSVRDKIIAALSSHLSSTHAQSILDRALRKSAMADRPLLERDMPELIPHILRAASLFVRPEERRRLEDTLTALTSADSVSPETVAIGREPDIVVARGRARQMCIDLGATAMSSQKVATVVSELARNIVLYTPGGQIELIPRPSTRTIVIRAVDRGTGIEDLEHIMSGNYKSKSGLGLGLLGSKRVSRRFDVETGQTGTRIEAELAL